MQSASHVGESLRDSEEPQLRCGVSLGEAGLRGGVQREVSFFDRSKRRLRGVRHRLQEIEKGLLSF